MKNKIIGSVVFLVIALGVWYFVTREPAQMVDITNAIATSTDIIK